MSAPRWDREGTDWPHRETSRFVSAAGLDWHVQVMGAGPVVMLLHGTGAASHSWRDVAPLLAPHVTLVVPDLPGHGFTRGRVRGGPSLPGIAGAIAALPAALGLDAPALVVGHSAGAAIAAQCALDGWTAPWIGLAPALTPFPGLAAKLFPAMARALFVNPFAAMIFAKMADDVGTVERFLVRATGSKIDDRGVRLYHRLFSNAEHCAGALAMMAAWDLERLAQALPRTSVPVLLIHGAGDAAVPVSAARRAAAAIPGAALDLRDGLGHLLHEENPAAMARIITQFARDHAIIAAAMGEQA